MCTDDLSLLHCNKCGEDKPSTEFYKYKRTRCKGCTNRVNRINNKIYRTSGRKRDVVLFGRYKLRVEQLKEIYVSQGCKCKICGIPKKLRGKGELYVDHDHKTKQVRGLLCSSCNVLLGFAKESPIILQKAVDYLTTTKLK